MFGYIEGSFLVSRTGDVRERYAPNIYRCIRHKYIGHEIENWWTSGGVRWTSIGGLSEVWVARITIVIYEFVEFNEFIDEVTDSSMNSLSSTNS